MINKTLKSCWVEIHCGLEIRDTKSRFTHYEAACLVQSFCNENKIGVSFTKTEYIYPGGAEPGFIVGLINYPRFPKLPEEVYNIAYKLAEFLTKELKQYKVTIVSDKEIITLFNEPFGHPDPMK